MEPDAIVEIDQTDEAFNLETEFAETVLRDRPLRTRTPTVPLDHAELEERLVVTVEGQGSGRRQRRSGHNSVCKQGCFDL